MSSDEPAVRVRDISKTYKIAAAQDATYTLMDAVARRARHPFRRTAKETFHALEAINLDVDAGEVVGLIGRNGAGKSTLLKILSRITSPDRGRVELNGRLGSLLEVGTGFHPELTGRENVYLNGAILGMSRTEITDRFDDIVEFAEISQFLDTPVKRYSSGMYVRLAFAVAAHLEPEILIIDEVLAVGDAAFQQKCLGKIGEVSTNDGRAVIFVSHNMTAVERLCDRCVFLDGGQIMFDGDPDEAIHRYMATAQVSSIDREDGAFDLSHRDAGDDQADVVIRSIAVLDDEGRPTRTVLMDGPLRIAIDVRGVTDDAPDIIGFTINTEVNQPIASFSSAMQPLDVSAGRARTERMTMTLDHLPLVPGRYWLNVGAADDQLHQHDYVERAAYFDVVAGPGVTDLRHLTHRHGLMYLRARWKTTPSGLRASNVGS